MVTSENPITSILPEDFGAKKSQMQSFRPSLCRGNVNLSDSLCGPLCPLWSALSCSGSYTTTSFPSPWHGIFGPQVFWGYFPCQGDGNDVVVYEPEQDKADHRGHRGPQRESLRFTFPRQREGRRLCISDFFAPKSSDKMDVIGFSLVTMGAKASEETQRLFEGGEYTRYLYLHGLSVETAEALAEYQHKLMRKDLGIDNEDSPHIRDLFHQKYRGARYSFGYPACPNLEDQTKLFAVLKPEENVGVRLTSAFLLEPEQSTSAIVVHHPAAKYFVV